MLQLENHVWSRKSSEEHEKLLAENPNFRYTPSYPDKYTISSPNLTSHDTEESENSPYSPHLGEINQALLHFLRAPGRG